ncbi:putative exported protein of unknown function (plasmid) [Bradyrhizobium sp. BTAi1]|nr:hypothetical protein [Bradyrhizobium sp. BTAi1]ABQ39788.1 putative exported protein of unknown function [Bradyrhizobium sp. BTAi1]
MNARRLVMAATVTSFVALPAVAQTSSGDEKNGHHYSGGPKTEVPHHMGKKKSTGSKSARGGSHHYGGGPKTDVPHHMGTKKEQ